MEVEIAKAEVAVAAIAEAAIAEVEVRQKIYELLSSLPYVQLTVCRRFCSVVQLLTEMTVVAAAESDRFGAAE